MFRLRKILLGKYTDVAEASKSADPLYQNYVAAVTSYKLLIRAAANQEFELEYETHFKNRHSPPDESGLWDNSNENTSHNDSSLFVNEEDDDGNIDDLDHISFDGNIDDGFLSDADSDIGGPTLATTVIIRGNRAFRNNGSSAYREFRPGMNNESNFGISKSMVKWYSIRHPIDAFPQGEEPLPGTYRCRFCDFDLSTTRTPHEHTHACAKKADLGRAITAAELDTEEPHKKKLKLPLP